MQLLDHVSIGVPNLDSARRFYDAIMSTLGATKVYDRPERLVTANGAHRTIRHRPTSRCTWIRVTSARVAAIGVSKRHPGNRSMPSTRRDSRPEVDRMANLDYGRTIIPATTPRFSTIRRAIAWKRFVISSLDGMMDGKQAV